MNEFGSTDPHEVSIPSADVTSMEVDRRCHIYINGRELPECETYGWFEAAIHEKAARERLDENGLARCGCGGKAGFHYSVIVDNDCYVECGICGEHSKVALCEEKARDAWNAALRSPDPDTGCPECSWIDPALSDRNYCKNCGRRLRDALTANDMENVCRFVEVEG